MRQVIWRRYEPPASGPWDRCYREQMRRGRMELWRDLRRLGDRGPLDQWTQWQLAMRLVNRLMVPGKPL